MFQVLPSQYFFYQVTVIRRTTWLAFAGDLKPIRSAIQIGIRAMITMMNNQNTIFPRNRFPLDTAPRSDMDEGALVFS